MTWFCVPYVVLRRNYLVWIKALIFLFNIYMWEFYHEVPCHPGFEYRLCHPSYVPLPEPRICLEASRTGAFDVDECDEFCVRKKCSDTDLCTGYWNGDNGLHVPMKEIIEVSNSEFKCQKRSKKKIIFFKKILHFFSK
jgi:hypothetical protein